jgi:hypothetical protein
MAAAKAGGKNANDDTRTPQAVDRITVALVRRAGDDLQELQERTGLSKTDLVNRAISLYKFVEDQTEEGKELLVRDPKSKDTQLIRFF